jgi:Holliday junction resolvase RusA-like endonuclease
MNEDILVRHARELTNWPKSRAAIALDVALFSPKANGARVDNICKWLLDELNGHVYADDRQVKMLFARASRSQRPWSPPKSTDAPNSSPPAESDPWDVLASMPSPLDSPPVDRDPILYMTAQTRANVLADLRSVNSLDNRWDPFDDEYGLGRQRRRGWDDEDVEDDLLGHYEAFEDPHVAAIRQLQQLGRQQRIFRSQTAEQYVVDRVFSSLMTNLPVDRFGLWGEVRQRLSFSPYIFNAGVLPGLGQMGAFQSSLRQMLHRRRERHPELFPMRARSGLSVILFEDSRSGKDLDNLVRTVLPDVLEILRPQQRDLPGWVADEPGPDQGTPDIPFIEVTAIPASVTNMEPGSVVFGLSSGGRFLSWWGMATDHLERDLEERIDRW